MQIQDAIRNFKANIFQALGHPARIAILEQLRSGELSAGVILERLKMSQANLSQHLAVLRAKHLVINRKKGNQVFYSLRNQQLGEILDAMRGYFERHMTEAVNVLQVVKQK